MPPKKGTKSKSPKLSKAEKEKLKKEEAERKAKEEEEARILAEQEEQEREEKERIERAEKERLAQQEKEQHETEVDELNNLLEDKYTSIKHHESKKREDTKWQRYMLCDGSPDPTITKEINTYMSLWKEDTDPKPIHKTLQELHDALKLIEELQYYLGDDPDLSEQDIEKHNVSITQLQNLIQVKLNEATMHILKNPEEHVDPDTQNIQFETKSRSISLNIWGNIARNPRIKSLSFDKESVMMDVPKSISVGNVAVRFIFTSYDHLSEKCRLFFPREKKVVDIPPPLIIQAVPDEPQTEETKENEDSTSIAVPDTARSNLTPKPPSRGRAKSGRKGATTPATGRKSRRKSSRTQVSAVSSPVDTEPTTDSRETEQEVVTSTPDESLSEKPVVEARPVSQDLEFDEDDDEDVVDLRAFGTTSRVIYMDFFELPPQGRMVKDWMIQQSEDFTEEGEDFIH